MTRTACLGNSWPSPATVLAAALQHTMSSQLRGSAPAVPSAAREPGRYPRTRSSLPHSGSVLKYCFPSKDSPGHTISNSSLTATCYPFPTSLVLLGSHHSLMYYVCHKFLLSVSSPPLKYKLQDGKYFACFVNCYIPVLRAESGVV